MIEVWGAGSSSRLQILQVIQNRALRNVFDIPCLISRNEIYSNLAKGLLPIRSLYVLSVSKFVFKNLKGISSSEVYFTTASHDYKSRNPGQLSLN